MEKSAKIGGAYLRQAALERCLRLRRLSLALLRRPNFHHVTILPFENLHSQIAVADLTPL